MNINDNESQLFQLIETSKTTYKQSRKTYETEEEKETINSSKLTKRNLNNNDLLVDPGKLSQQELDTYEMENDLVLNALDAFERKLSIGV